MEWKLYLPTVFHFNCTSYIFSLSSNTLFVPFIEDFLRNEPADSEVPTDEVEGTIGSSSSTKTNFDGSSSLLALTNA